MARRKTSSVESESAKSELATGQPRSDTSAEVEAELPTANAGDPAKDAEGPPKNWGPPSKSVFSCGEMGFELGEDHRFNQRKFLFAEKPNGEVLQQLKDNRFIYRAAENTWTIPATYANRELTDKLARDWAEAPVQQLTGDNR